MDDNTSVQQESGPEPEQRSNPLSLPAGQRRSTSAPRAAERWVAEQLVNLAGGPSVVIELWNGERIGPTAEPGRFTLRIGDRKALYSLLSNPNLAFGDLYSAGRIDVDGGDLAEFLTEVASHLERQQERQSFAARWVGRGRATPNAASERAARGNIQHHYDLGNEFYRLWLDRAAMQYTCAYYEEPGLTLEQAQLAKLEHVCRKLALQPGQQVVELGCGWGGLARYMAREYGVSVRAFNISREQVEYAREQAAREGLDDRVEYVLDDYRNISGEYDAFVSVGMLEHVGTSNYSTVARLIREHLRKDGLALIHTIGRNRQAGINAWIEKRIFPGAYPPSITQLTGLAEAGPLSVLDIENLRLHYAETLTDWLARYEDNIDQVRDMYDEHFVRAWRLYLSGSIAAFRASSLQLFQMVLAHPDNNGIPRNRKRLHTAPAYPEDPAA
ncbi:MAG: cyclopropane-fatty-acyl-phospholipid synthase family protein [Halofilum sp. (in: g-proteobacteria)]|nr:cyclopropane-fatty-acyl-phospholipid synthase family protein [Halofilum sp. (in: g-proteobacteria)]